MLALAQCSNCLAMFQAFGLGGWLSPDGSLGLDHDSQAGPAGCIQLTPPARLLPWGSFLSDQIG